MCTSFDALGAFKRRLSYNIGAGSGHIVYEIRINP
jgi:hypothetical protein